jgi:hypothetical protein
VCPKTEVFDAPANSNLNRFILWIEDDGIGAFPNVPSNGCADGWVFSAQGTGQHYVIRRGARIMIVMKEEVPDLGIWWQATRRWLVVALRLQLGQVAVEASWWRKRLALVGSLCFHYYDQGNILVAPETVLERKRIPHDISIPVLQWIIKWMNLPMKAATWEDSNFIQKIFDKSAPKPGELSGPSYTDDVYCRRYSANTSVHVRIFLNRWFSSLRSRLLFTAITSTVLLFVFYVPQYIAVTLIGGKIDNWPLGQTSA